jgi:RNA polymerase sigma-70 factor (sigma-E family)
MSGSTRDRSFEQFVVGCSTRLMRSAYLLCGDRQLAEDLLQAAMMRTARRWSVARAAPEPYARAVLVNLARDQARRGQRRVGEVLVDLAASMPWAHRAVPDHAEEIADRNAILDALSVLPQRQREVVVLRFYADLSVADTAAAIGASEGTVMSYTSRGLSRLRELLGERIENESAPDESEVQHGH